ncbi:ethanolamine ammonia-lyase reactivating factor EutA [Sporomusa sp.]|uniref:ethanolamine ammonia-lyase reactivating factor EutA n=1 Tax=Sporomusa sp. TaxID=2078658 RepID=UPI002C37735E|nr:ethanolamine ammonia-lyase reactivating factor EutA [Sporomusa sp.]HWR07797.1 ethanolamine ammonia-lyase reactivating factor EutA [Sporomusa sp.]
MTKEITLTSIGIDIGTTTTQMVLSRLTLVNVMPGTQVPKIEITRKSVVYMGAVHFTPFLDRNRVDGATLRNIIAQEYQCAGIQPQDVDTGAVIITGETAKKENASEIVHALAEFAGEFVVATAGPDLESVIAGKGSGAEEISRRQHIRVANLDIGGGTSNIAFFDRGVCIGTACINVGGRLFEIDPLSRRLSYISPPAQKVASSLESQSGRPLFPACSPAEEQAAIQACLAEMAQCVDRVLFHQPAAAGDGALVMTNHLPAVALDGIIFSGGVARYVYQPQTENWWVHGDVGPLLAEAYRDSRAFKSLKVYQGEETIHATVLGAGVHTVNVSGSTVMVSKNVLPLRNIPAIYPEQRSNRSWTWINLARNFDQSLYRTFAFVVPPLPDTNFTTIVALAQQLATELMQLDCTPKVVVARQDIGKVLGQSLRCILPEQEIVCLDGIELKLGDFLDIAKPLPYEEAVPVIVKTLVFAR